MKSFRNLILVIAACLVLFSSCKQDPYSLPETLDINVAKISSPMEGNTPVVSLYATRDWSVSEVKNGEEIVDWVSVFPSQGEASTDSIKIYLTIKPNTGILRTASFTITAGASEKSVTIEQQGVTIPDATPISTVRAMYTGSSVEIKEDISIRGVVTSDYRDPKNGGLCNATSAKNLVLQDQSAGITVRFTADNIDLAKGDEISISLKGLKLEPYRGTLQLNNVPLSKVLKLGSGHKVDPISITPEQLLSGEYESMYVSVSDVQTLDEGTFNWVNGTSHTSRDFIFKTGETFVVFSSSFSAFGGEKVPTGSGTLKGIVVIYDDATQLSLTSRDDYAGLTGERFEVSLDLDDKTVGDYSKWSAVTPVAEYYDDFAGVPSEGNEFVTDSWMFYTTDGSSVRSGWKSAYYSWNKYMDVAPFNSVADEVVSYALMPPVNVGSAAVKKLSVKLAFYYQNQDDSKFEVVVSEDFSGDFSTAKWTVVKDLTFDQDAAINNWVTKTVDMSEYSGKSSLAVAFRYTGKQNTYRMDNVCFGLEPDPETFIPGAPPAEITSDMVNEWMELPVVVTTDTVAYISHHSSVRGQSVRNYSMLYDTHNRVALWTAYHISPSSFGPTSRSDNWEYDPKVPTSMQPTLYSSWAGSGYDRGHIVPSATRTANYASNSATFFFTNMTAQNSKLNQGVWGKLEEKVRDYSSDCDTLYVVTGSVLKFSPEQEIVYVQDKNGKDVARPRAYYKVLLKYDLEANSYKSIAFWYENKEYSYSDPKSDDTKSVAWIEEQTGLTFFNNLPESVKQTVKNEHNPSDWGF